MDDNIKEVLDTLEALVKALSEKKLDVKKDFSLMVADTQARKLIHKYKEAVWKGYQRKKLSFINSWTKVDVTQINHFNFKDILGKN